MIPWLGVHDAFPPVTKALRNPNGLLAAGADLSTERLLDAYARGIFPWFGEDDPLLWWSPDPRMVLWLRELHLSRSLRRTIRARRYTVTLDRSFLDVMHGCAAPRADHEGTWITPGMIEAYSRLAAIGYAHSVEVWSGAELAGGLYGVALGRMFFGESMFSRKADASKVALALLIKQLERWSFELIDCQMSTTHLKSLGAREIPRSDFLRHVKRLTKLEPVLSPWVLDADLVETI
jgi:leucyl/phenylalanyl-tRNA--protein transferase